tara:strand:+ start:9559 stop:10149 length:591 start_codon:yes stop_codon:yes gene_type:complete
MSDSITGRILFNVFKASLLFIGLTLLGVSWLMNRENLIQDDWPVTKGKVFYSQPVEVSDTFLGRSIKHFDLSIKYGYIVNKVRYNSTGLFVEDTDKTLERAYFVEKAKEFSKGKIVDVHYNPENPKQSYLVANIDEGTRTFYAMSQKIVAFCIFLFLITPLLSFFKEKRYRRKNKVDSGLIVPENARRITPEQRRR